MKTAHVVALGFDISKVCGGSYEVARGLLSAFHRTQRLASEANICVPLSDQRTKARLGPPVLCKLMLATFVAHFSLGPTETIYQCPLISPIGVSIVLEASLTWLVSGSAKVTRSDFWALSVG